MYTVYPGASDLVASIVARCIALSQSVSCFLYC
jgi:hypothetical protein